MKSALSPLEGNGHFYPKENQWVRLKSSKSCQKSVNETKDFVRLAFAADRHLGLLAFGCPRVAQRAPLGKTGLIAKEPQGLALLGLAENLGPAGVTPLEAFGLIEVIGDKTGFLRRKAHILE